MKITRLADNLIRFDFSSGSHLFFSYIKENVFRIYEDLNPHDPINSDNGIFFDGVIEASEGDDISILKFGDYALFVNDVEDFHLQKGDTCIDFRLNIEGGRASKTGMGEGELNHPTYDDNKTRLNLIIENDSPVYGLGDKPGPLDHRGYQFINYNADEFHFHAESTKSVYKSVPFFSVNAPLPYGVFVNNTYRTIFDINHDHQFEINVGITKGVLDCYFFVGSLLESAKEFALLQGTSPLPPRWGLGYQQSRWSYASKEEVEAVVKGYKKIGVPLSAVYLDIAYMDRFMDFSINEKAFPNMKQWIAKMNKQGVHIVPIIDAGVKVLDGYRVYEEGVKGGYFSTLNGENYINTVWPGDSMFPSFCKEETREWWSENVRNFLDYGFSGIWNDMNEPSSFKGPLPPDVDVGGMLHEEGHNLYGHYMDVATFIGFIKANKRPYIVTRACYAGTSHYANCWTGDNFSSWDHLRLAIPQQCNMAISAIANTGTDIGGFTADTTKELLIRWMEAGVFSPLMRNHSSYGTMHQEGYAFDVETAQMYRDIVLLRYRLIPYLYDLLWKQGEFGEPVLRALPLNFPSDPEVANENTEFMLGDSLLAAPVVMAGQNRRAVYLPKAAVDFYTGLRYEKGAHLIGAPIGHLPLFVLDGGIMALNPKGTTSPEFQDTLVLLSNCEEGTYVHYEDSGDGLEYREGSYNVYELTINGDDLDIKLTHDGLGYTHYKKIVWIDMKKGITVETTLE